MTAMEFLRDVGKYFTVNYLLAKESVKRRIESEEGISYTEFSYSLLQAYDFLVLHDRFNCRLQVGGSDQWGNIVAGTDLIRKLRGTQAYGVVIAAASDRERDANSARPKREPCGSIASRTSPFRFYQFWFNSDDRDVVHVPEVFHVQVARGNRGARARDAANIPSAATRSASWRAR